jgi:hypothetical protein
VVGSEVLTAVVMKCSVFWDITPCRTLQLPRAFTLVSCLAYPSTLKIEAILSSEKSVDFQQTTRRYISEDRTLRNKVIYLEC